MKSIFYPLIISIVIILVTFAFFQSFEGYFSDVLHELKENPLQFAIFSFLILSTDIILPVPSSIVLYINGFFLGPISGALVSICGLMVGAVIGYYIGSSGSNYFKPEKNLKAQKIMSKYGPAAIFLTRGIPVLSESICFVCGYNKINLKRYLILNFIGYLPICFLHSIFGNLGYEGGGVFLLSFTLSIALSVAFWFFGKRILPEGEWEVDN